MCLMCLMLQFELFASKLEVPLNTMWNYWYSSQYHVELFIQYNIILRSYCAYMSLIQEQELCLIIPTLLVPLAASA